MTTQNTPVSAKPAPDMAVEAMPKMPPHPEPHSMTWSRLELETIDDYGRRCFEAGRAALARPQEVAGVTDAVDAARWRRLVNASEMAFPVATIVDDPENEPAMLYGRKRLEDFIDRLDEVSNVYAASREPVAVGVEPKLANLLRRATTQIERWSEKYGEFQPEWLPPAGDVRLLEDIEEFLSTQKGGQNAKGPTLRADALTVGRDTVTNAQDRVNLDAFTDLAMLKEADTLRAIAGHLEVMLASAQQHSDGDSVTGYTIKTGALHRIIGLLVGNGFRVIVPLATPSAGAGGSVGAEPVKHKYPTVRIEDCELIEFDSDQPDGDFALVPLSDLATPAPSVPLGGGEQHPKASVHAGSGSIRGELSSTLQAQDAAPVGEAAEQRANLDRYLKANYPNAKGSSVTARAIFALEEMDVALGMKDAEAGRFTVDGSAGVQGDAAPCPAKAEQTAGRHFLVLSADGEEGVLFKNERDARWTAMGTGTGSDFFGVPTLGEAFRDLYDGDKEFDVVEIDLASIASHGGKGEAS